MYQLLSRFLHDVSLFFQESVTEVLLWDTSLLARGFCTCRRSLLDLGTRYQQEIQWIDGSFQLS